MTEEEQYTDVDISDVVGETENYLDDDYRIKEFTDTVSSNAKDSEVVNSEIQLIPAKGAQTAIKNKVIRSTDLPMGRIKNIMKMDPDVHVINTEAVFLVTKATEMFLETMAKETYGYTKQHKRKTITKKDLDVVINKVDCLCFLEGAMDF